MGRNLKNVLPQSGNTDSLSKSKRDMSLVLIKSVVDSFCLQESRKRKKIVSFPPNFSILHSWMLRDSKIIQGDEGISGAYN